MLTAFGVSIAFLACYLTYHYQVGSVRFQGTGPIRPIYYTILLTHVLLAAAVPVLASITIYRGLKDRRQSAPPDCPLDLPDLAVCIDYGSGDLRPAVSPLPGNPLNGYTFWSDRLG